MTAAYHAHLTHPQSLVLVSGAYARVHRNNSPQRASIAPSLARGQPSHPFESFSPSNFALFLVIFKHLRSTSLLLFIMHTLLLLFSPLSGPTRIYIINYYERDRKGFYPLLFTKNRDTQGQIPYVSRDRYEQVPRIRINLLARQRRILGDGSSSFQFRHKEYVHVVV